MRRSAALVTPAPVSERSHRQTFCRRAFFLYPFSVFSGLGGSFQSTSQGGNKSQLGRRSGLCRPTFAKRPHLHTVFRRALPFPFTPVRFFRVSGTFSQKSTRVGCGAAPHIYILPHVGARGAEPRINLRLDMRQVCIDIHSSAAPCLFPIPQSGFFGSRVLFPKKVPERGVGQRPTYTFLLMSESEAEPRI